MRHLKVLLGWGEGKVGEELDKGLEKGDGFIVDVGGSRFAEKWALWGLGRVARGGSRGDLSTTLKVMSWHKS